MVRQIVDRCSGTARRAGKSGEVGSDPTVLATDTFDQQDSMISPQAHRRHLRRQECNDMTWSEQIAHFQWPPPRRRPISMASSRPVAKFMRAALASHRPPSVSMSVDGVLCFRTGYSRRRLARWHAFSRRRRRRIAHVEGEYPLSTRPSCSRIPCASSEILGYPIADSVLMSLAPLLGRVETNRREHPAWHWHRGFIALALLWARVAGHRRTDAGCAGVHRRRDLRPERARTARVPRGRFETHASLEAVIPAWKTTLAVFPTLGDAHEVTYSMLPWIARIVYHDIGGEPLGRVGEQALRRHAATRSCRLVA